ncbi:hypothetical protein EDB89DRAFT_2073831 [Lactarius sanguifluus]|nr:hypothetical protein EDB89DRAFT_2073831 [Lactarius sanguifluus]
MTYIAYAFLPGIRHPSKASATFISPPSTSSSRTPSALALGATPSYYPAAQGDSSRNVWAHDVRVAVLLAAQGPSCNFGWRWRAVIDNGGVEDSVDAYKHYTHASPTSHLPTFSVYWGPPRSRYMSVCSAASGSSYTRIYLSRRRFLCQVAADMYFEDDSPTTQRGGPNTAPGPRATVRKGLQLAIKEPYARRPKFRFSTVRITRSDIKLIRVPALNIVNLGKWSELDRIHQFNADPPRAHIARHRLGVDGPRLRRAGGGAPVCLHLPTLSERPSAARECTEGPPTMTPMMLPQMGPDRHCTGDLPRLFEVYKTSGALHFIVCVVGLPNVSKEKVRSVASQVAGRTKEPRFVQLEYVLQIVDSPGIIVDRGEGTQGRWSNRKILMTLPPTVRSVLFFPSRLRSNTLPSHVAEILTHLRAEEPMKTYPLPISNTTPEFTKTFALISSCRSPSSPPFCSSLAILLSS